MKSKRLWLVLVLAVVLLAPGACKNLGSPDGNGDDEDDPNFVEEACTGCMRDEQITSGGQVTGYRFYSYVKNIGGTGKIGMSIGVGSSTASKEFNVTAGKSYTFRATVTVQQKATASFTYMAKFPGKAGYTDSHSISGYDFTGGPSNMEFIER